MSNNSKTPLLFHNQDIPMDAPFMIVNHQENINNQSNQINSKDRKNADNEVMISDQTKKAPKNKTSIAIFYNMYLNPEQKQQSLDITREQIQQIYNSTLIAASVGDGIQRVKLYYNVMGANLTQKQSQTLCPNFHNNNDENHQFSFSCHFLNFFPNGDEADTLESLYNYCAKNDDDGHDDDATTLVYAHNKGSFHISSRNNHVRQLATLSVTCPGCLHRVFNSFNGDSKNKKDPDCNVCAMKIFYLPNTHAMANMWTAHCSYIKTLVAPKLYERRRREMFWHLLHSPRLLERFHCFEPMLKGAFRKRKNQIIYTGNASQLLGLGRYAYESWILSGPDLMPCHVIGGSPTRYDPSRWTNVYKVNSGAGFSSIRYEGETARGWFQLYGRIFTYQYLYQRLPPPDSWFWERLPQTAVTPEQAIAC